MTIKKRPFILLTNDDGIRAKGLEMLYQAVLPIADVAIVAPHAEKSGAGLSITWVRPLMIQTIEWSPATPAWSVSGTPADCVKMALSSLLTQKPDMVLSGINKGSNSGRTLLYSGTVGGAIEASFQGVPSIAFSFSDLTVPPLEKVSPFIAPLVQHMLANPLPNGTFLNVNFPFDAAQRIKGFKLASQGQSLFVEDPEKRIHPEGTPYYWLGGKWKALEETQESDVALLAQGYVTGVPIRAHDLTDRAALNGCKLAIEALFQSAELSSIEDATELR